MLVWYERWQSKDKDKAADEARSVRLEGLAPRLTLLARALSGHNIEILPAEAEGGWKGDAFYLPARFSLLPTLEENLRFYLFRTVWLSIQYARHLNWHSPDAERSVETSRLAAQEAAPAILAELEADFPALAAFFQEIRGFFENSTPPATHWLYGKFMFSRGASPDAQTTSPDGPAGQGTAQPSTEIQSKPVEEAEVIAVDKKRQEDYLLTHNFEKVETAEEFSGVWRGFDGDDTLQEDAEALNELNLRHLVRTDEAAHSIYRADFRDSVNIAESTDTEGDERCLSYPEWDFSKKRYKPDHCKVFLRRTSGGDPAYAQRCLRENAKTLRHLRLKFAQIHQTRQTVKKLPDGEALDTDALVDWFADLRAGRAPTENLYFSKRKKDPDLSVLFLLDLSLSTDSYADGNRVLDVEKQAIILFGEVLEEYRVDFAVSGFCSKTRNHCIFRMLKDFHEPWHKGKPRIGAVQPEGYTRIGAALRHARTLLQDRQASQKWLILLSDGKPNDFDQYEGRYGVADVKQALREMHERHISSFAVAVESVARYYLPQMFGQNHYNILSHPDALVPSLATLYRRMNQA
ncbi:MAG TPA: VWA domain-containing protein [Saprospiraceae bacterium]|nr:VWA domain-containing protein [Saprospiraceae bacterium]